MKGCPGCPVIIAVVSIVVVMVAVTMVAFYLFHRRRMGSDQNLRAEQAKGDKAAVDLSNDKYYDVLQRDTKTDASPYYSVVKPDSCGFQNSAPIRSDQNLRAEQAKGDKAAVDLSNDKYYDVLQRDTKTDASPYYSVVKPDSCGFQNSAPIRYEPLCSSEVYEEPA
ncbi:uncharacterized protein [Diadema antillarum]|uniref:uncharacterized protein n=1 Tax=Diadema antillarum TaxID=105358 RepID=UPI003A8B753A